MVVTTDIRGVTLDHGHFLQDLVLVLLQLFRQLGEEFLQFLIAVLVGQLFRPVAGQVEVGAPVVQLASDAGRRLVVFQQTLGGLVQGLPQQARPLVVLFLTQFVQGHRGGQEFTQGIPAQVVFLNQLLHVLGRGTAGTGLVQAAAV